MHSWRYSSNLNLNTGVAQSPEHCFGNFVGSRLRCLIRFCQISDDLPLALARNFAVAPERRHRAFMPEVLAPCLKLFGGFADFEAELDERVSKTMRIEIRQVSLFE